MEGNDSILAALNPAQRAAVTSPSAVIQILAPPGSGKTKTLTSRVAYLLKHYNYAPWNIICVTFTIKSAREMKERIGKLIGHGLEGKLVLGTFHSVCRRYLVNYGYKIGLRKGFGIADSSDSEAIIKRIIKRSKLNIDPKAARARISSAKSRCKGVQQLRLEAQKSRKQNVDQQEFIIVFEEYEADLAMSNLLDYDDLLLRCVDLLDKHPKCVSNVEAVLVDEFQDTNNVQYRLMNLLAANKQRITTVGDPDQSIYGWRSAEVLNLSRMRSLYPDTLVINLENNYRSTAAILSVSLKVIEQDESRPAKPLIATHSSGTVPTLRKLPTSSAEASWIITELNRCVVLSGNKLLNYSDFAILLRSAALSRQIESALGRAGIPYRMVGGLRFFDRVEVKILLDYMRVVSQPDNSDALARILNLPNRGIGETSIKSLMEESRARKMSLYCFIKEFIQGKLKPKAKITKNTQQGLEGLFNLLMTLRNRLVDTVQLFSPQQLLETVWKRIQFKEYLEKKYADDHENRWANVEELIAQAQDYNFMSTETADGLEDDALPSIEGVQQESGNRSEEALTKFLANVALATELQRDDDNATDGSGAPVERVTLSTIHAAKGLEWPVVFIPSAYDGSIPHSRAEDKDEERRLLYVAMTRAQVLLYISCPVRNSRDEESALSPFLAEKEVASRFANQGPCLRTDKAMPDIARILNRDCPSQAVLNAGLERLERLEDDFWPLDPTEDADDASTLGRGLKGATYTFERHPPPTKKRKIGGQDVEYNQQAQQGFTSARFAYANAATASATISAESRTGGFVPASSRRLLDGLSQGAGYQELQHKQPLKKSKGGQIQNKGTLMALWKPKTLEILENDRETSVKPDRTARTTSKIHSNVAHGDEHGGVNEDISLPPLDSHSDYFRHQLMNSSDLEKHHNLSKHPAMTRPRLNNIEAEEENKHYVFLSSSPTRSSKPEHTTGKAGEDQYKIERTAANHDSYHQNLVNARRSVLGKNLLAKDMEERTDSLTNPSTGMRPSSTLHNTSMAQLKAREANAVAPRRTLGTKRSINGWSCQSKGFNVPRMARG